MVVTVFYIQSIVYLSLFFIPIVILATSVFLAFLKKKIKKFLKISSIIYFSILFVHLSVAYVFPYRENGFSRAEARDFVATLQQSVENKTENDPEDIADGLHKNTIEVWRYFSGSEEGYESRVRITVNKYSDSKNAEQNFKSKRTKRKTIIPGYSWTSDDKSSEIYISALENDKPPMVPPGSCTRNFAYGSIFRYKNYIIECEESTSLPDLKSKTVLFLLFEYSSNPDDWLTSGLCGELGENDSVEWYIYK